MIYGICIEPYRIEITQQHVEKLFPKGILRNKTAVHLSDLHISRAGKREERVLSLLKEIKPDFIFLTGDYISWKGDPRPAIDFLSQLKAKYGVWAVMGDYDYSNSRQSCVFCHLMTESRPSGKSQVRFLRNTVEPVLLSEGTLWIGGLDNQGSFPYAVKEQGIFFDHQPDIVLSHDPFVYNQWDKTQETLILAGDTHGGQVPIPSGLWHLLGYEKNARYNQGWFKDRRTQMYISRGVGTSHFPIRIMRRPELVVFYF